MNEATARSSAACATSFAAIYISTLFCLGPAAATRSRSLNWRVRKSLATNVIVISVTRFGRFFWTVTSSAKVPRAINTCFDSRAAHLHLLWQEPSHEALLLRHLDGSQTLRPSSPAAALTELMRRWPDYIKGSSADRLSTRIGAQQITAAASVETSLREFLQAIGFL